VASTLVVRELQESELDQWDHLVASSLDGSVYSTPAYLDVLCGVAGGSFRVVGVWLGDQLSGGIALYVSPHWYGAYAGPRLLLYYHSPVLRHYDSTYPSEITSRRVRILAALADALARQPLAGITLKCRHTVNDVRPFTNAGWWCTPSYTYIVPIGDLEAQKRRVEQNLRRLITRAEKHGITVTEDDDVETFHRLHAATMYRKDAGLYLSREAWGLYFARLRAQNLCRLYHARLPDGTAIAGQLVLLGPSPVSHTVMAVTDEAHLKLGASAFLRWKAFESLAGLGYTANDLTDAALNPVTHFKSQLGGTLELCHVVRLPPSPRLRFAQVVDGARWKLRGVIDKTIRRATPGTAG
jgi:hypothetical protein